MRPKKRVYDFYSKEHKDFVERIFDAVNDNIKDSEVVDDDGIADQYDVHNGSDFYMFSNYYPITAWSKGNYQFGDNERKAVDEFIDRCYKDAEEEGVDLEENDHENEFDWFKDEFDYESQYGWYVRFYLDFGEYPDYPEDGYVLYAEFVDGNGNKHNSDNNAFITMNDDEDTIEKKVSRFMDNLNFSDKDKLRESKTIKEFKSINESTEDYEQAKNEILDAYRNLDEEDLSYVQQIKELCEKAEKLYDKLEPTDEESKIIWDEIDPSGYTGYEEQLVDMIIAIDILLSLRKGTFKNSKTIKEAIKVPSSAKKKGNDLIKGIEDSYYIKENKIDKRRTNMKRTIKEYVEPKTFEDKALFDDFKDSIGGRCFNKDSVYRWVYKLTDIKPTDDEIYEIMDKWVKNKWAYKKENERTGANFYYFDLKETVSESKKNMKRIMKEENKNLKFVKSIKVLKIPFSEIGYFGKSNWQDAITFAENNKKGWRLPNEDESILISEHFEDTAKELVWNTDFYFWTNEEDDDTHAISSYVGATEVTPIHLSLKDDINCVFLVR